MIYLGDSPVGIAIGLQGLTEYAKITATPTENACIEFTNPLSHAPKLVVIYDDDLTTGNKIMYAVASLKAECGAAKYTDGTSGKGSSFFITTYEEASTTNARAYLGVDKVHIHQITGTRTWSPTEYTIELWA